MPARRATPGPTARPLAELRAAFAKGTRLTQLLRLVTDRFGPDEFDISAALPDAPDRLLHTAARTLADRFGAELDRLFTDHRDVFTALTAAGYAAARGAAGAGPAGPGPAGGGRPGGGGRPAPTAPRWRRPQAVVAEAAETGVGLDVPAVRVAATAAVERRRGPGRGQPAAGRGRARPSPCVTLVRQAGVAVDRRRAQEAVYDVLVERAGQRPRAPRHRPRPRRRPPRHPALTAATSAVAGSSRSALAA